MITCLKDICIFIDSQVLKLFVMYMYIAAKYIGSGSGNGRGLLLPRWNSFFLHSITSCSRNSGKIVRYSFAQIELILKLMKSSTVGIKNWIENQSCSLEVPCESWEISQKIVFFCTKNLLIVGKASQQEYTARSFRFWMYS